MEEASAGLEDFGKLCQHTSLAVKAQKALRSDCGCSFNCDFKVFVTFICDTCHHRTSLSPKSDQAEATQHRNKGHLKVLVIYSASSYRLCYADSCILQVGTAPADG